MRRNKPEIISVWQFMARFPTDEDARRHIETVRWGDTPICPKCASDRITIVKGEKPLPYRCKDCRRFFSVKTGTVFQSSNLSYTKCLYAIYLFTVAKKSISSCQLARELGVTQKTAWFLAQRIRETWMQESLPMQGCVETDETYLGGKEKNKHKDKKLKAGRGAVGKHAVVGFKERETNRVTAECIKSTSKISLQNNVMVNVQKGATLYTDGYKSYTGIDGYNHHSVNHSAGEYVRGQVHTNGIESFWALLKRGYYGTFHHLSLKHLNRYIMEFSHRHNQKETGTIKQINLTLFGMNKLLGYKKLIAEGDKQYG